MKYKIQKHFGLVCLACCLPATSHALSFEISEDWKVDWDSSISYTAAWRASDRDTSLITTKVNNSDGSYNFDKNDLITNRLTFLTEADFNYKDDYGFFVRAKAFRDNVYHDTNSNSGNPFSNYSSSAANEFSAEARDKHGDDARLLDAFFYGQFEVGDKLASLRVGDQVVSWGESLFIPNGIASNNPVDVTAAAVPGVELKEIFLPVGILYGQMDLSDKLSVEAFYQYGWEKSDLNAAGTYFSDTDFVGPGADQLHVPGLTLTRGADILPEDEGGQWGLAFHYLSDYLGETDFGFYLMNYHDQAEQIVYVPGANPWPDFAYQYFEDIRLIGFSFGTAIGDANVSGEISYRDNFPVPLVSGVDRVKFWQAQASIIYLTGANAIADDVVIVFEVGANTITGDHAPDLLFDESAWGYVGRITLNYYGIAPGLDLFVPINFRHGVNGTSSAVASGFKEGSKAINVSFDFRYKNNFTASIAYTDYFGHAEHAFAGDMRDRDFLSLNFKYAF